MSQSTAGLRPVPHRIENPQRIPAKRYYSEEFHQAEIEHLWPHVWQMACRLEQIQGIGDWIEYTNVGHSVIVVRTKSGVKAFHNACRHRGVPFAGGSGHAHGNCAKAGFVCPFHGWRWDMEGNNTFVFGRHLFDDSQLDADDINLRPCRVETWGGCAFINLDDNAPSFRESLGPILDSLDAHHVSDLRAEWCYATVLPANWKTAMEAFMEGYHVQTTHPQLHQVLPTMYEGLYEDKSGSSSATDTLSSIDLAGVTTKDAIAAQVRHMELINEGMAGELHAKELEIAREMANMELPDNPAEAVPIWFGSVMAEITTRLRARGENTPDLIAVGQSHPLQGVEYLFPHFFLLPFFSSMASYRVRPLTAETCFFEIYSLTMIPEGEDYEPVMEPTVLPYDSQEFPPIPRQDYSNIPIQQKGVHAIGFEFMRLAKGVEGLISNYQRTIDGYIAGVEPAKLVKAVNALGGNFDGPIKDLGF